MATIALHSASTGLSALSTQLDVIANNLANVNTAGFKASRVNFQDLLYQERAQPGVENANGDQRPTGLYVGLGVKVSGTQLDFGQGAPNPTDNDLDMMIDGAGFFAVQVQDDLGEGGVAYTRAGNFTKNAAGEIVLATDQGRRLEPDIVIPDEATGIEIMSTGEVYVTIPGQANTQLVGQIEITGFINPTGLKQIGENLFVETEASGPPVQANPGEAGLGTIIQSHLESSNVDPTLELISLIKTQRAFEMNSQTIRAADDVLQSVAQLRR